MGRLNDGSRPSRLAISRHLAGEAPLSEADAAHPAVEEWAAEVRAAQPPAFDAAALRARAARGPSEAPARSGGGELVPLFRRVAPYLGGLAALAAGLFLVLRPPDRDPVRTKGGAELGYYVLRDGDSFEGAPDAAVRPGDRLQFRYGPAGYESLVLVGVDGTGTVQTYWPDEGGGAVPIAPGEPRVLDWSIQLDDARGPEVFVGSFSGEAPEAVAAWVAEVYAEEGIDGLVALDQARPDLAVLVLEKR